MSEFKPFRILEGRAVYFLSDTVIQHSPVFKIKRYCDVIVESLRYCYENKGLQIHAFVIMPTHVHYIASSRNGNLKDILRDYKRYTARTIIAMMERNNEHPFLKIFRQAGKEHGKGNKYKFWGDNGHPQLMDYNEKYSQKIEYIHHNPVKAGLVEKPEEWEYSSAVYYYKDITALIPITNINNESVNAFTARQCNCRAGDSMIVR